MPKLVLSIVSDLGKQCPVLHVFNINGISLRLFKGSS